jgi:chemosensory pili system protein ChpC
MTDDAVSAGSIRSLLLQLQDGSMLLPYSVVQEIIAWRLPDPVSESPAWLLGLIQWRRWRLPVVSAETLLGADFARPSRKAHIVICNLLTGDSQIPCAGIVSQSVPQLVRADADNVLPNNAAPSSPWVAENLRFRETDAWIPDLATLAGQLSAVLT